MAVSTIAPYNLNTPANPDTQSLNERLDSSEHQAFVDVLAMQEKAFSWVHSEDPERQKKLDDAQMEPYIDWLIPEDKELTPELLESVRNAVISYRQKKLLQIEAARRVAEGSEDPEDLEHAYDMLFNQLNWCTQTAQKYEALAIESEQMATDNTFSNDFIKSLKKSNDADIRTVGTAIVYVVGLQEKVEQTQ